MGRGLLVPSAKDKNKVGQEERMQWGHRDTMAHLNRDRKEVRRGESVAVWCDGRRPWAGHRCILRCSRRSMQWVHSECGARGWKWSRKVTRTIQLAVWTWYGPQRWHRPWGLRSCPCVRPFCATHLLELSWRRCQVELYSGSGQAVSCIIKFTPDKLSLLCSGLRQEMGLNLVLSAFTL